MRGDLLVMPAGGLQGFPGESATPPEGVDVSAQEAGGEEELQPASQEPGAVATAAAPRMAEEGGNTSWFLDRSAAFLRRAGGDANGQEPSGGGPPQEPEPVDDAVLAAAAALAADEDSAPSSGDDQGVVDHPGLAVASGFEDRGTAVRTGPKGKGKARGGRTVVLGGPAAQVARPLRDPPWLVAWRERRARDEAAERVHQSMAGVYRAGALGQFRQW